MLGPQLHPLNGHGPYKYPFADFLRERHSGPDTGHGPLPYHFAQFLPSIYQGNDGLFLRQFLEGLEPLWAAVEGFLEDASVPYDTRRCPPELLPWLASWVGIAINHNWPEAKRRELVRRAVDLYQKRGTIEGIQDFLEIYTGVRPQIGEALFGSPLGPETRLDENAVIGDVPDHCFVVTVFVAEGEAVELDEIRRLLDAEKPAHTAYELRVERHQGRRGAVNAVTHEATAEDEGATMTASATGDDA